RGFAASGPAAGFGPALAAHRPEALRRRQEQALLAMCINHPGLLDALAEPLGQLSFSDADLDKLRQETLLHYAAAPDLEIDGLLRHLKRTGSTDALAKVLGPELYDFARFARPGADAEVALRACRQIVRLLRSPEMKAELA